jgi:hypothetical protein
MKGNKLIILSAILVVVVAIIILGNKLGNKAPSEKDLKFFPAITAQSIGSITITEGTNVIKVRRKGGVWAVAKTTPNASGSAASPLAASDSANTASTAAAGEKEYPVDSASIASALEKIVSIKKDALVSENTEKQTLFEVDSVKGLVIDLADVSGKAIGTLIMGKSGPDYNSNYVRTKGSNSVYMAFGGARYSFFTDLNRWRDKTVLNFDKSTAKGLTIVRRDSATVTLAKADSGNTWSILQPIASPARSEEVESMIEKLAQFNTTDYQDEVLADSAMGFDKPTLGITVSLKNGSSRNLIIGKKNSDNKYWVKTDGKEQVFLVAEYTVNPIDKKLGDLKADPPAPAVPADTPKKK